METLFHLIFVVTFLSFTLIRAYYHRKARRQAGKVTFIEGRLNKAMRLLFGLPYMGLLFIYMVYPPILAWASFALPEWARWLGAVISILCLPLILWIQWALGVNFSTTLHVRDEHTLVTNGPYRWVRHPMYTAFYLQALGLLLLTANAFIGGIYLLAFTVVVLSRVGNEERTMLAKFGDQYRAYMQRTGRFLPKITNAN